MSSGRLERGAAVAACVLVWRAECLICTEVCSDERLPGALAAVGVCMDM